MVRALPSEEWPASASANSAQPRGFLFWNWTRAGPTALAEMDPLCRNCGDAVHPLMTKSDRYEPMRKIAHPGEKIV